MYGQISSTGLYARLQKGNQTNIATMAAGLPHFSTNYMRCWGRDVFIAIPGLLLHTQQFDAAKSLILGFGSTLKHGLIPNLLDSGRYPRYNARDATWWWIWSIVQYTRIVPNGKKILSEVLHRRFPPCRRYRSGTPDYLTSDDDLSISGQKTCDLFVDIDDEECYNYKSSIGELVHEIMDRHSRGIKFVEHNAGPRLDHAMSSDGFKADLGTLWDKGFVYGGNSFNCGTWMDKMGDSKDAGNFGIPATPRDGCAVEIVGLQKAALHWIVNDLSSCIYWKYKSVSKAGIYILHSISSNSDGSIVEYTAWNSLLQSNFEKHFFIPSSNTRINQIRINKFRFEQ